MKETIIRTRLTNAEKETILHISLEDNKWYMDSTIPRDFNKALKQGWEAETVFKYEDGTVAGMILSAPSRSVFIAKTTFAPKPISEERKQKLVEVGKASRKNKKSE